MKTPLAKLLALASLGAMMLLGMHSAYAQAFPSLFPRQQAKSAREMAPVDFTGQWVSVIMEDWRWRMVTPLKGDFSNIPVNAAAREVGETWDPGKDTAAGEQCKGYSAPALLREPGRVRISWQDDNTLKLETDAGQQIRLLNFSHSAAPPAQKSWQGYSVAKWEDPPGTNRGTFGLGLAPRAGMKSETLEVTTSQVRPGYLRKNGVPFSEQLKMKEYFDLFAEPDGTQWFVVTTIIEDPQYLNSPWVTSLNFKREKDPSKWRPTPCSAT